MKFILLGILLSASVSTAQTSPSSQPARYVVNVPPGFSLIEEHGHRLMTESADATWARQTAQTAPPATRPSTMPADLLARLNDKKAAFKSQFVHLFPSVDPARVDELIDKSLQPQLQKYQAIKPSIILLVSTNPRVAALLQAGQWSDPHFRLNRATGAVEVSRAISLSVDGPMDDSVVPVFLPADGTLQQKRDELIRVMRGIDADIMDQISNRAQAEMQLAIIAFLSHQVFEPLKLTDDQRWLGMGVSGVLSSHLASMIDGIDPNEFVKGLSQDRRMNPIHADSIDLLHPTRVEDLRQEAIPAYSDAYQRKAIRVAAEWVKHAGTDAPGKVIAAMQKQKPGDGTALLALIKMTTGSDLTEIAQAK